MLTVSLAPMVIGFMVVGFLLVSLLMILIVLIQRPSGGGLSEAFGSNSGSGHTAFGAKTGDALTTATIGIFILFIVGAIVLNFATRPTTAAPQAQATEVPAQSPAGAGEQAPQQEGTPAVPITVEGGTITPTENPFASGAATIVDDAADESGAGNGAEAETAEEDGPADEPSTEEDPQ